MRSLKTLPNILKENVRDQSSVDASMTSTSNGFGYKNLGRKKSNPAWAFFFDLREQGLPGIKCRHCEFASDDRSPLTMKYHIKKVHNTGSGGLWSILEEQYRLQAEGKNRDLLADFSTSINSSIVQSSSPESTRTRSTRHSLNLSPSEYIGSKKDRKDMTKENKPLTNTLTVGSKKIGLVGDEEASAPILSQEFVDSPSISLSNSMYHVKTELEEDPCAPPPTIERAVATPSDYVEPHRPRNSNLWIHLGRFDTEEEMHAVRSKQKVSKRRAEVMKHGTKVRYRCNRWKRTKCAYQMYAYFANSKIDLYESGEHDHSGEKLTQHLLKIKNKEAIGGASSQSIAKQFKLSQEDILKNLLRQATNKKEIVTINALANSESLSTMEPNEEEAPKLRIQEENPTARLLSMANVQFGLQQEAEKRASSQLQLLASSSAPSFTNGIGIKRKAFQVPDKFTWLDESSRSQLMELATELGMTADFAETGAFTLTSTALILTHKAVRFVDQDDSVEVVHLHNQLVVAKEVWTKGDWSQFLWAVRGKCMHYLSLNSSAVNSTKLVALGHRDMGEALNSKPSSPTASRSASNESTSFSQ